MQVTGKLVTWTHGRDYGNGAWFRPMRAVGRKLALKGGTLIFITGGKWNCEKRVPFRETILFFITEWKIEQ
jgi:hypothetical protein